MNPEQDKSLHREAPLVHLISVDVNSLSGVELEQHLRALREIRSSPITARAKTERKPKKSATPQRDLKRML